MVRGRYRHRPGALTIYTYYALVTNLAGARRDGLAVSISPGAISASQPQQLCVWLQKDDGPLAFLAAGSPQGREEGGGVSEHRGRP